MSQGFLLQTKKEFDIPYDLYHRIQEKHNFKQKKLITSDSYSLYLGSKLFEEMLRNYKTSLKRKRFPLSKLEMYHISYERKWLIDVLPSDKLYEILKSLSPHAIAKILGLDGNTIRSLARNVYNMDFKHHGHYITIRNSIRWNGSSSPYYENVFYWENYLKKLGKFKKDV